MVQGSFMSIRKRYSEFDEFREHLVQSFPDFEAAVPPLPPKSVISKFRPRFLEKRRAGLQYFLQYVPQPKQGGIIWKTLTWLQLYSSQPRVLGVPGSQGFSFCIMTSGFRCWNTPGTGHIHTVQDQVYTSSERCGLGYESTTLRLFPLTEV